MRRVFKKLVPSFWQVKTNPRQILSQTTIDLFQLVRLFTERSFILIFFIVPLFFIALIEVKTSRDEYVASSSILSEESGGSTSQSSGNLGLLAELAGVSMSGNSGSIQNFGPGFYPYIINNSEFLLQIASSRFYIDGFQDTLILYDYFLNYDDKNQIEKFSSIITSPSKLKGHIGGWFKNEEKSQFRYAFDTTRFQTRGMFDFNSLVSDAYNIPIEILDNPELTIRKLTGDDMAVISMLLKRIEITPSGNFINLSTTMPEPLLAAQFNKLVFEKVINVAVWYRTQKQRRDLKKLELNTKESKRNFEISQEKLAMFRDNNRGQLTALANSELQELQADFNIKMNIYSNLATQLEQARISLSEATPIYREFEPVTIPLSPNATLGRSVYIKNVAVGVFLGFLFIIGWIFRDYKLNRP